MANRGDIQEATGRHWYYPGQGNLAGWPTHGGADSDATTGVPINGTKGFAPGAIFFNYKAASAGTMLYVNVGTFLSATWVNLDASANLLVGLLATAAEINRSSQVSTRIVNVTAATLTVTLAAHENKIVTINAAAGCAVTLPNATGTGGKYTFFIGTTITSNSTTFTRGTALDVMSGVAITNKATSTYSGWNTAANTNTITMDGSTKGGILGDIVELIDVGTNQWWVRIIGQSSGTVATPFSNT